MMATVFAGMALLEGHTVHAAVEELQSKFWSTYKVKGGGGGGGGGNCC